MNAKAHDMPNVTQEEKTMIYDKVKEMIPTHGGSVMDDFLKQEKSANEFIGISKDPIMNIGIIEISGSKY